MTFPNTSIVLVEPQGPLNIGSTCRVMLNFGFSDLRLVNPKTDHQSDESRRMAVKGTSILDNLSIFDSLPNALADCNFAMGTTRRFGKYREDFLHPDQAAKQILSLSNTNRTALVFGREDHGLSTSELDQCQGLITIPTNNELPSMNLAQAVSICLYEINKLHSSTHNQVTNSKKLANGQSIELMMQHMRQTLIDIDYSDPQNPDHILRTFRKIFGRAQLTDREVHVLHGVWSRIDWIEEQRQKNIK